MLKNMEKVLVSAFNKSTLTMLIFYGLTVAALPKAGLLVANLGYCNPLTPKILTRLGKKGKVRQLSLAEGYKTFTYASFNWIEEVACVVASSLRLQRPLLRE